MLPSREEAFGASLYGGYVRRSPRDFRKERLCQVEFGVFRVKEIRGNYCNSESGGTAIYSPRGFGLGAFLFDNIKKRI